MFREIRDWVEELACRAGLDGLPSFGRAGKVIGLALCAGLVVWFATGGAAGTTGAPAATAATTAVQKKAESLAPAAASTVTVHVVGEVRRPGVYELPSGSRVRDAVDAAGGLLGGAEQSAVNLARPVVDGEQIVVPREGAAAAGTSTGGAGGSGGKVDLNSATAEQLDALPGVGPSTAAKIVADREANGPFRTVDDLMRVSGIGPAKFEALKDLVRAN